MQEELDQSTFGDWLMEWLQTRNYLRLLAALDLLVFDLLDIVFPCLHAALYRSQDRNWTFPSGLTVRLPEIQRNFRLKR